MIGKSDAKTEIAPRIIPQVGSRVRLLVLLTALGLSTLPPSGAAACGRLPPGVEPSGPVLRGSPNKGGSPNPAAAKSRSGPTAVIG